MTTLPKPKLNWVSQHDPRSLDYPIRAALPTAIEDKPKQWKAGVVLDQGQEGSCVGHGWTASLLASPKPFKTTAIAGHEYAVNLYDQAKREDDEPGEDYEGTSVLAGAKVVQERGFIQKYHWAFSVEDVRDAVISSGPVTIGINWYESMYETRPSGLVEVSGPLVGGHCLTITGYHPSMRIKGEDWNARYKVFRWRNSWGESYGLKGDGLIRYEDLRDLLAHNGEACIPVGLNKVKF